MISVEAKRAYDAARYQLKKDEYKARRRIQYQSNPQKTYDQYRKWVSENRERSRAIRMAYKARRRAAERQGLSGPELKEWVDSQPKQCFWCGVKCEERFEVDHFYPLAKGGLHQKENLVIACCSCNRRKSAMMPDEFLKRICEAA